MTRLWKSSLTPWCLLPPRVHVLLCGLCGWKVRPLWPSSVLHCGRNLFFLLDGRGTDEPKPPIRHPLRMVWVAQTPHPSSVTDGIGKWPGQPSHGQTVTVTQKRIGLLCIFPSLGVPECVRLTYVSRDNASESALPPSPLSSLTHVQRSIGYHNPN